MTTRRSRHTPSSDGPTRAPRRTACLPACAPRDTLPSPRLTLAVGVWEDESPCPQAPRLPSVRHGCLPKPSFPGREFITPATSWVHRTGKLPATQEPSEPLHALLVSISVAEAGLSGAGQQGSAVRLPLPNITVRRQLWGCRPGLLPAPLLGRQWAALGVTSTKSQSVPVFPMS